MVEQDYYELLGVSRTADGATIKSAYRRLAMECHPDRHNGCSQQAERFKQINEAYDVLKDPQKRAAYDRFGKAAFQNGGGDPDTITEKTNALAQVAMKLGEAMYKAQQAETEASAAPDAGTADAAAVEQPAEEEVVDAEFSEVDEENKG